MQTTKQQILVLLKRTGTATVEEAAGALSVASMTARQHLTGLERDGLVLAEKVKRRTGRPHFLFRLTPKGENMFPRRYDILAQLFLEEVGSLEPEELIGLGPEAKRALVIQRAADRLADRHRFNLDGRPLADRVAAAAELLHTVGGFAEWFPTPGGFEIRDFNCVFASISADTRDGCPWHVRLLNRLLSHPVTHEVFMSGAARCCRYLIIPGAEHPG